MSVDRERVMIELLRNTHHLILSAVDDDVYGLYGGYNDTKVKPWVNTIT